MSFLNYNPTIFDIVHVVVNFLSQVIFLFLLFLGMLMYANGVETKEKWNLPEIKINYNIHIDFFLQGL